MTDDLIRYSQCWEDTDLLLSSLPDDCSRVISIASAGDNSLSLLAKGVSVLAVDRSSAQLALTELKAKAIANFNREQTIFFLGARDAKPSKLRLRLFEKLAPTLSEGCLDYFEKRLPIISGGVLHCGKLERYFALFRKVHSFVHSEKTLEQLFCPRTKEERLAFYEKNWNTFAYRLLFKSFFSSFVMKRVGRERSFFRYCEGGLSKFLVESTKAALVEGSPADNCYLRYILTGAYGEQLPFYLREENYQAIKNNINKLTLVQGSLSDVLAAQNTASSDLLNLSDVFEYMDLNEAEKLGLEVSRVLKRGGRLAYWNMIVDRKLSSVISELTLRREIGQELSSLCQTFFYRRYLVEEAI